MSPKNEHPIEYIATLHVPSSLESTKNSLMSCVIQDGYSLMRPLAVKDKVEILSKIIDEGKTRLIGNLAPDKPQVACAYTIGFDKYLNTVLLLARKDLPKLQRHLTPRKIDQIQWYHPKTNQLQKGIEGLLEEVDKKYALEQMSKTEREQAEELMQKGTVERICKLLGGKDDAGDFTSAQITQRSFDKKVYDEVLKREVTEESGRPKIVNPVAFAEIIEIKDSIIKKCMIYVSKLEGERGPKKFSLSEVEQDLVEIYVPFDLAWLILHETFNAKVRTNDINHRKKMSACARSLLAVDYFKDHEDQLMKLIS